jgi:O-methyltransferase
MDPQRYIELVKSSLTVSLYKDYDGDIWQPQGWRQRLASWLLPRNLRVSTPVVAEDRENGKDHVPTLALTMVGRRRLDNLHECVETALEENIAGDLIETGVWRGGCLILMQAILTAHGVTDRTVFAADSFEGMPKGEYAQDKHFNSWDFDGIAVSMEQVKQNLTRYGLLDGTVFLPGWFKDTLPEAPDGPLAVVRLDGDFYESTMTGLQYLYPRLSSGGFLIVDDYNCLDACKQAVDDYREQHRITVPMKSVDWAGIYWRKD